MNYKRSIDIEDTIRMALTEYIQTYCKPLPAHYTLPNVLVTQVGGTDADGQIDYFEVVLDARAENEAEANETLRNAIGILRSIAGSQGTPIRHVTVNSSGSWGTDPVRPELSLCSARLRVIAHLEDATI